MAATGIVVDIKINPTINFECISFINKLTMTLNTHNYFALFQGKKTWHHYYRTISQKLQRKKTKDETANRPFEMMWRSHWRVFYQTT